MTDLVIILSGEFLLCTVRSNLLEILLYFYVPLRSQFSSLSADSTFPLTALSLPPLDASAENSETSEPYYANQTVAQHSAGTPAKAFSSIAPSHSTHAAPVLAPSSMPVAGASPAAATGIAGSLPGSYSSGSGGGGGGGSKAAQLLRAATHPTHPTHPTNITSTTSPAASPSPVTASTPPAGSTHTLLPPSDAVLCQTQSPSERQNGFLEATSKFGFSQPLANGDHPTASPANEVRGQ